MKTGMLWFDDDRKTALDAKVLQAAEYYHRKYGGFPNLCLVHPSMIALPPIVKAAEQPAAKTAGSVVVRAHRSIQPGHLWIGEEQG